MEHFLDGVMTRTLNIHLDERGYFSEALRMDWHDFIDEWIVQVNLKNSYPDIVTAWHRHLQGQVDYFIVIQGTMKICAYDGDTQELEEIILSQHKPMLARIPGHYWHGLKTVGAESSLVIYFTTRLYNYNAPDEENIPWDDPAIVPVKINGRINDPRTHKQWDWFYSPHK